MEIDETYDSEYMHRMYYNHITRSRFVPLITDIMRVITNALFMLHNAMLYIYEYGLPKKPCSMCLHRSRAEGSTVNVMIVMQRRWRAVASFASKRLHYQTISCLSVHYFSALVLFFNVRSGTYNLMTVNPWSLSELLHLSSIIHRQRKVDRTCGSW